VAENEQSFPTVVMTIPRRAADRAFAQRDKRIALRIEIARGGTRAGRMQKVAVLSCEQEDQTIHQSEQLAEEIGQ